MIRNSDIDAPHRVIPGGAHTYSRGDDQFPALAPRFIERGEGAAVWDDQGNRFIDWTMGLRSVTLGYGVREIDDAAIDQIRKGSVFGRPSRIESELAQDLIDLIPCAEMAKFAKHGSVVNTAAVKLARAYTGRPYVAFCKDHPFFSFDDWFIGTTPCNNGIPPAHHQHSLPFRYNDLAGLEDLFRRFPGEIAAVIMEPATVAHPAEGYLQAVQAICRREGAVFILDEMITGFRWHLQGGQKYYGVTPDLATFGKGLANGYSVSALVGRREIMELGGLHHDQRRVFLVSTTHGSENHGLAAARVALRLYRTLPVVEHMWAVGGRLIAGLNEAARAAGIAGFFEASGLGCRPEYVCRDREGAISLGMRTLFMQEMIRHGILLSYIVPTFAHGDAEIDATLTAARSAFAVYARALDSSWEKHLIGAPIKPVFREYN